MNTFSPRESNRRSRRQRLGVALALLLLTGGVLAACAPATTPTPAPTAAPVPTEPPAAPTMEAQPTAAVAAPGVEAAATLMVAQNELLGAHLVGADGKTLYLFLKDAQGPSACYDACAQNWPPLLVEGDPAAGEGVDGAKLGVVQRTDGANQVTYNGWPLYFYANDAQPGDVNGQGVIGQWFVVSPAGEKVEAAAAAPATPAEPTAREDSNATGYGSMADAAAPAAPAKPAAPETKTFVIVPEQTTAQYSIDEVFIDQNNRLNTAVGKTNKVEGTLVLNFADPAASELGQFTVDISTLQSDSSRRDNAIRDRWLESARYPTATFVATEIRNFPPDAKEGEAISFQIVGDMTVRQTTREQVWDVTATLNGDTLTGTATTFLLLADYGVPVPEILGMLKVTDGLTATLNFTMQAQ